MRVGLVAVVSVEVDADGHLQHLLGGGLAGQVVLGGVEVVQLLGPLAGLLLQGLDVGLDGDGALDVGVLRDGPL
ncbi:MAG: hypothetical protein ACPGYV_13605, partial [Phycisphaeraceae bacterium]